MRYTEHTLIVNSLPRLESIGSFINISLEEGTTCTFTNSITLFITPPLHPLHSTTPPLLPPLLLSSSPTNSKNKQTVSVISQRDFSWERNKWLLLRIEFLSNNGGDGESMVRRRISSIDTRLFALKGEPNQCDYIWLNILINVIKYIVWIGVRRAV